MRFTPEPTNISSRPQDWHPRAKQVLDLHTGDIYSSIAAAARVYGVGEKTMRSWLQNPKKGLVVVELKTKKKSK